MEEVIRTVSMVMVLVFSLLLLFCVLGFIYVLVYM